MNIDKMQAGREMDALIAERVMGVSVQIFGDPCYFVNYCLKKENGDLYYFNGECPTRISIEEAKKLIPRYSTDIAAAWEVVEKLSSEGYFVNVCRFPITNGSNVHIQRVKDQWGNLDNPVQLRAETVPLAICRAALKALEVS